MLVRRNGSNDGKVKRENDRMRNEASFREELSGSQRELHLAGAIQSRSDRVHLLDFLALPFRDLFA